MGTENGTVAGEKIFFGHANEFQTSITSRIGYGQVRESPLLMGVSIRRSAPLETGVDLGEKECVRLEVGVFFPFSCFRDCGSAGS